MDAAPNSIPEYLPGEPRAREWSWGLLTLELTRRLIVVLISAALLWPTWVLYGLARLVAQRPANIPSPARVREIARAIWVEPHPAPGLRKGTRLALTLGLLKRLVWAPTLGLTWLVDELLYGRALANTQIVAPLFELSAARSGSTQLAHYLDDHPGICAPNSLQIMIPSVTAWKLSRILLAPWVKREWVQHAMEKEVPPEFIERHEMNMFRTDTFEIIYLAVVQWADLTLPLSPEHLAYTFAAGRSTDRNRVVWEDEIVRFIDGLGRRTLFFDGGQKRLMIKGHFLASADKLAQKYPDARFLTVLRPPDKRIQSHINFLRCSPRDHIAGPNHWQWLIPTVVEMESVYSEVELQWYTRPEGPRRVVVRFSDYLNDLPGTLRKVFRECLDQEVTEQLRETHAERERGKYSVNRSLAQLGVDTEAINKRLADYRRWCQG